MFQGFFVERAAFFSNYYSSGMGDGAGNLPTQPGLLGSDFAFTGTTTMRYVKLSERNQFRLSYTPSYTARAHYSDWNSFDHDATLGFTRHISPRLLMNFDLGATVRSLQQFHFGGSALGQVIDPSLGLAGAGSASGLDSNLLPASAESPAGMLLYGNRVFTGVANLGFRYSLSPRLALNVSFGAIRTQHLSSSADGVDDRYAIAQSTSGSGSIGLTYDLTQRTQVGVSSDSMRQVSTIQDAYLTSTSGFIARSLGRHWNVRLSAGTGITTVLRRAYADFPTAPYVIGGGTLGYHTRSHTFSANVSRRGGDSYGVGSGTSVSVGGSWDWADLRNRWQVSTAVNRQYLQGTGSLQNLPSWHVTAAITKSLTREFALTTQYSYITSGYAFAANAFTPTQHALRVGIVWTPLVPALHWR